MNVYQLISKYYTVGTLERRVIVEHSLMVATKALHIAVKLNNKEPNSINEKLVYEGAMLHDIGLLKIDAPGIGCHGSLGYLAHADEGYKILYEEGFPIHARFSLTHSGTGISSSEIVAQELPMNSTLNHIPQTIEEKIVSYSDLFYSKQSTGLLFEKSKTSVINQFRKYGDFDAQMNTFLERDNMFSGL